MQNISPQPSLQSPSEYETLIGNATVALLALSTFLVRRRQNVAVEPVNPSTITIHGQKFNKTAAPTDVFDSVKIARNAIGRANKPLLIDVLFDEARARGLHINTDNPKGTYGGRLRDYAKRVNLIFLKGFGWWQSERPYKPANYVPNPSARRKIAPAEGRMALPSRFKQEGRA